MARLFFDPEPLDALERLESNEDLYGHVLDRLDARLAWLEEDPQQARVRRTRFSNGLWYVHVPVDDGEDWALLWEPHPDVDEAIVVRYLGLDFK